MFGSLMVSRTALCDNMMAKCSRLLAVKKSGYFFFMFFRVLHIMESVHSVQQHNLSSRQNDPVKKAFPGTTQSQSTWITFLVGIFKNKSFGDWAMLARRSSSDLICFVMLHFSSDFHTVLRSLER